MYRAMVLRQEKQYLSVEIWYLTILSDNTQLISQTCQESFCKDFYSISYIHHHSRRTSLQFEEQVHVVLFK